MMLDPVLLSRLQFAFTVSFHIVFPAMSIGLAAFLVLVEYLYLKTGDELYERIYKFWSLIFALGFGMGVVSGLVMSFEFGTNFSRFAQAVGPVIGPIIGLEVMSAFFLEAGFLGIMLFGWGRVGRKLHFAASDTGTHHEQSGCRPWPSRLGGPTSPSNLRGNAGHNQMEKFER